MFTYFFSLAIIAFEVICCKIFFESFCDSSGENRKYKRTILLVLLIAIYYICGFTLSKWIVLKQLCAIMSTAIIMRFYFEISLVKSAVFAILYQGLLMLVDYLVYAGNSAIVMAARQANRHPHRKHRPITQSGPTTIKGRRA